MRLRPQRSRPETATRTETCPLPQYFRGSPKDNSRSDIQHVTEPIAPLNPPALCSALGETDGTPDKLHIMMLGCLESPPAAGESAYFVRHPDQVFPP